jgi:hypothetical protein
MALSDNALVGMEDIKAVLSIQDDRNDGIIEALVEGVSAEIAAFCDRPLRETTHTAEPLDGPGSVDLQLPAWPITSGPTISVDGEALTEGQDFAAYDASGVVKLLSGTAWPAGIQNIEATWSAGYTLATMPKDVKLAAIIQTAHEYSIFLNRAWGVTNKGTSGQNMNFENEGLLKRVKDLLSPYRRRGV